MIAQFKIFDYDKNKVVTSEDKDIEFTHDKGKLIIWRTKMFTMKLGDLEADVEGYDFIDNYEIIELIEL